MRIGWLSSQWPRRQDEPGEAISGLLPGRWAGGAEFLQEQMRLAAPAGVEFLEIRPGSADLEDRLAEVDRVVVASPERLGPAEVDAVVRRRPDVVWAMTIQPESVGPILEAARHVAWASDRMRVWHPWAPAGVEIGGYFPTADVPRRRKRNGRALWAARSHPLKGRLNARLWALEHRVDLDEITDAPRGDVLDAMASASYFVHRPLERDPCPTTVTEALIAGCEIVVNDRVGRIPATSRDEAIDHVESIPGRFYGLL